MAAGSTAHVPATAHAPAAGHAHPSCTLAKTGRKAGRQAAHHNNLAATVHHTQPLHMQQQGKQGMVCVVTQGLMHWVLGGALPGGLFPPQASLPSEATAPKPTTPPKPQPPSPLPPCPLPLTGPPTPHPSEVSPLAQRHLGYRHAVHLAAEDEADLRTRYSLHHGIRHRGGAGVLPPGGQVLLRRGAHLTSRAGNPSEPVRAVGGSWWQLVQLVQLRKVQRQWQQGRHMGSSCG